MNFAVLLSSMVVVAGVAVWMLHVFSAGFWHSLALVLIGYAWGNVVGYYAGRPVKGRP